jgi:biopolymer transport protein ExbD
MGISVSGSVRGIFVEMNVVPLIDVLLVLLVIFMIIPHKQKGLMAELPPPVSEVAAEQQTSRDRRSGICRRIAPHQSRSGPVGSIAQ